MIKDIVAISVSASPFIGGMYFSLKGDWNEAGVAGLYIFLVPVVLDL